MDFLKNLKIGQKLILIVVVMGLPVAMLVSLFIDARNVQIEAAETELSGVAYLAPLKELLVLIPEHRSAAAAALRKGDGGRARVIELQTLIDNALGKIDTVDLQYGREFDTATDWAQFKASWRELQGELFNLSPEQSIQRHIRVMAELTSLMRTIGDRSKLALDPQLDTHFLIDAVVTNIPQMVQTLSGIEAVGQEAIEGVADTLALEESLGTPPMDSSQTLNRMLGQAEDQIRELDQSATTGFEANRSLKNLLEGKITQTKTDVRSFLDLNFRDIVAPLGAGRRYVTVSAERYPESARAANTTLLGLYDELLLTLNGLLEDRISDLNQDKYLQLLTAVFVLASMIVLVLFLNRTITAQIAEINTLFSRISVGDLQARAVVRSRDELGQMTSSLNQVLDNTLSLVQSKEERDRIEHSIEKLLEEISGVAEGDLTQQAEVTAEVTGAIADSFNYMIGELRGIIAQVQQTTLQVSAAANDIQSTAEQLASGSEQQSSQIRTTTASVDDMAQSIQRVSANAASAAEVAKEALQNALAGADAVAKTTAGMTAIRTRVQETAKRIKRLGESSQEIGEIVQLIGDLADRTSILALNASIKASAAGEAGRGFAIVAEEVEGLAERATDATQRVSTLIKGIQQDMAEAVAAMEDTTLEVVSGSNVASEAGRKLEQIEGVSKQLAELIQSISKASREQAQGSEDVAQSMGQISKVTQQTADGAHRAAHSIRNLTALADELRNSVSRFRIPANMG